MTKFLTASLSALAFLFFTVPSFATPITPQQAQVFYTSCSAKPDPNLTASLLPGSLDVFCKCSAQHLAQSMSLEDVKAYVANDRTAVNKYLVTAYAPCMEVPVHDSTYSEFIKQGVPAKISECVASGIGKYTATEAQRLLGSVLSKYPNAFDPVAAIKQTPEFEEQEKKIATQCAQSK